jgi:23S rRNA (pseudouridine1915-N3)-methyltransferase
MRIEVAYITPRRQRLKSGPAQSLLGDYLKRAERYMPVQAVAYESEDEFLTALDRSAGRAAPVLVLLDSRGEGLTSEKIAERLGRFRDDGTQLLIYAIGPADGWSPAASKRAQQRLSLGAVTLPHELALVVLTEQIYRALTILAGHPYHSGHG